MISVVIVAALTLLQTAPPEGAVPVKLFLGSIPSPEGFVHTNKAFWDSYRDLREQYRKDASFQKVLVLVDRIEEADLCLEIVDRGRKDTGSRRGTVTANPREHEADWVDDPVQHKYLLARLTVIGSNYSVDLDGATGLLKRWYRNQAKNLLQQTVDWVQANRAVLANIRSR